MEETEEFDHRLPSQEREDVFFVQKQEEASRTLIQEDRTYYEELDALFFGLIGFCFEEDKYTIHGENGDEVAYIRKVINQPGEVALARSLKIKTLFGAIGCYSRLVSHELAVPRVDVADVQKTIDQAYAIVSCLRIVGAAEGIVPAALERSWSIVGGITDNSCDAYLVEDIPKARKFRSPSPIRQEDIDWLKKGLPNFSRLLDNDAFAIAVDSYCSYGQSHKLRLIAAALWSGIEALFNVDNELRFRLALYIAALTESPGEKRVKKFKRIRILYDIRSKIIHGRKMTNKEISNHIAEVSLILGHILYLFIHNGRMVRTDELEEFLLFPEVLKINLRLKS